MSTSKLKILFNDIRFWITIFFIIRLIGIMNAPLEISHNWRQSLTNMIARNFSENVNILYPTIDMAGEKTGIIGSEFPFFNYLIHLISKIFGHTHWSGRLINLFVSSAGLYYFFKLVKNILSKRIAFNATIVLSVSIWFAFSRKIMPDTFSVSLVLIGLYFAYDFLKKGPKSSLLLFFVFSTLGILCKIPALSLFSVLFVSFFIKKIDFSRKLAVLLTGSLSFILVSIWYFYWVPFLLDTYQYRLYFPKGIVEGIKEIIPLIPEFLEKFYFSSLSSYSAFACFLAGVFFLFKSKNRFLIFGIGIVTSIFIVFIIKTGAVFPLHNYYIIPFTPIMALLTGYAITKIPPKFQSIILGLIVIEGIANQQHDFFIKEKLLYKLELESITDKLIPKEDLIVINGGPSPQDIYFSNRKGWTVNNRNILNAQQIDSLKTLGAKYLIIDMSNFNHQFKKHEKIFTNKKYTLYKLKEVK